MSKIANSSLLDDQSSVQIGDTTKYSNKGETTTFQGNNYSTYMGRVIYNADGQHNDITQFNNEDINGKETTTSSITTRTATKQNRRQVAGKAWERIHSTTWDCPDAFVTSQEFEVIAAMLD